MRLWSVPVILAFVGVVLLSTFHLADIALEEADAGHDLIGHPFFAGWVAALAVCQLVLLIRVKPSKKRPKARRKLLPAAIAAGFCFTLLLSTLVLALLAGIYGDDGLEEPFDALDKMIELVVPRNWDSDEMVGWVLLGVVLGQWVAWVLLLWPMTRSGRTDSLIARWFRWLLSGSVIELLVAVPCHVVARRRDDCCAPYLTFWGIVTGLSLLLLSLGPAVILLFTERARRKRPAVREAR